MIISSLKKSMGELGDEFGKGKGEGGVPDHHPTQIVRNWWRSTGQLRKVLLSDLAFFNRKLRQNLESFIKTRKDTRIINCR